MQIELCHSSLADWLSLHGIPVLMRMKFWFKQIVSAVGYIHDQWKIHRDLKPSNIIFVGYNQVKVCDLGIVTDIGITNGNAGDERTFGQGTAMYMAPEQKVGQDTPLKFALGLILFEMTTTMSVDDKAQR
ncbi:hypothetical protein PRIPAC_90475 [Pristionchus pacificus]|nr:hypothetical protein PRIPAC_90475 [Pristionchus pacificus]